MANNNQHNNSEHITEEFTPKSISFGFAKRHHVILAEHHSEKALIVYTGQPKPQVLTELRRYLNCPIELKAIPEDEFSMELAKHYETDSQVAMQMAQDAGEDLELSKMLSDLPKAEDLMESEDDAPIIRLINAIFTQAIKQNASDIHVETFEEQLLVRFRVDGVLRIVLEPQRTLAPLIISRLKVMAKLDIAEKRLPQDGRIALRLAGRAIDIRVSTMPSTYGERIVLRLLDKKASRLNLSDLGMPQDQLAIMTDIISKPHGIVLVTGPTGSGKTTSLYAALTDLNDASRNILTVEDPIEYYLPGIGQTQVNTKVGMTFAKGLRAMLRQDPDVVLVGEIRDLETADIAVQASLTGHLVLSTLHTNTAIGAITRLQDMGVEPFLLSSSLIAVIAQRLVRVLCDDCKKPRPATAEECIIMKLDTSKEHIVYDPVGCNSCEGQGYRGRTGIYEIVPIKAELRELIHQQVGELKMSAKAREYTESIRDDGIKRILQGDTTLDEVQRVTGGV